MAGFYAKRLPALGSACFHGPIAGSRHRSWRGRTIIVIGLTLNARDLPRSCTECNQHLRMMALAQRVR